LPQDFFLATRIFKDFFQVLFFYCKKKKTCSKEKKYSCGKLKNNKNNNNTFCHAKKTPRKYFNGFRKHVCEWLQVIALIS